MYKPTQKRIIGLVKSELVCGDVVVAKIEIKNVNRERKTVDVYFKKMYDWRSQVGGTPIFDIIYSVYRIKNVKYPKWIGCESNNEAKRISRDKEVLSFDSLEQINNLE